MTGLQKQVIPVQLGQGVDTKTDPKLVVPGKLTRLENAVLQKRGRISKRNGYTAISNLLTDGSELPAGDSLATFNDELLLYGNQKLYGYSSGADRWVDKGAVVSAIVKTRQVIKNTYSQTQVDSAAVGGVSVYAWEDGRGSVRATVIDEADGTVMLGDTSIASSATRARCLAFGNYLYVFYYKSGVLYARRINPRSPTAFESAVTVSSTVNTSNPNYDVLAYQNLRIMYAHNVQGASEIKVGFVDVDLAATLSTTTISEAATNCLGIIAGPSSTFYLAWHNVTGMRCAILNNGGGVAHAAVTLETPGANAVNVTGYQLSDSTGVKLLYEITAAATYNHYVRQCSVLTDGTAGTAATFLRSVGLCSKAFTHTDANGNANSYVGVTHESTLQATYFLARSDGLLVAKQQYAVGGGLTTRPVLANVWSLETGVYCYALTNKTQLYTENARIYTPKGVCRTSVDFTNQDIFTAAQLGPNLHIVGGLLSMYDGASVVEHGFHLYPENVSAAVTLTGGYIADGTYQYIAVYEWTDNYGQVHRSAPSVALSVSVSGSSGTGAYVVVTVPTLRLTAKRNTRTSVSIAVYRTEAGGDVFYRVTPIDSPTYNDTTTDTVTYQDTTSDANLVANEILYSTGGVLEHFAPPACSAIAVFKNRLFLTGLEDGSGLWYSKEFRVNEGVAFNDELVKRAEPGGGDLTSIFVLDDKLLCFKPDRYYYTYGDGPNNTGQLGDFAELQFVTADVGCTNAQSLVRTPDGVMLETAKGIYLIDAGLKPTYLGDDVEDFNALTITSANLVSDLNQVRFTTSDGACLVYDYYARQWYTFTNHQAVDAIVWQGTFVLLRTDGAIWREDASVHKDAGAPIRMALETGWLALASVVGMQRVYKVAILGDYKSPHQVRVSAAFDYSPAYTDKMTFQPATALTPSAYGDGSPYGSDSVYGGPSIAYRFVAALSQQKCQAVRFRIEELTTAATAGSHEAFTITTIGLLAGLKSGLGKFKAAQNLGMSR